MPLNETSGNLTTDAFGGGVAVVPTYIEDVFSTYLYTGNSSTQTITNNIDLSTKGGLVWIKERGQADDHGLYDTVRPLKSLYSNSTAAEKTFPSGYEVDPFNTNGFTVNPAYNHAVNTSTRTYVAWTFRKQPKFFDVVTYTGNGTNNRAISHSLGSEPGCIIVKSTSDAGTDWVVYHRSYAVPTNRVQYLNSTVAVQTGPYWPTAPTSTNFYVAGDGYDNNTTGQTYVAYLFAHNAGGFGLTGTDNVISCGSFTTDGSGNATVSLGYEPQWVMVKRSNGADDWYITDSMRGFTVQGSDSARLRANSSAAEALGQQTFPSSTGFTFAWTPSATYIYIAIRRGPMKVPTVGTSVFDPVAYTGTNTNNRIITSSITPDAVIPAYSNAAGAKYWYDRLRGNGTYSVTSSTAAENTDGAVYGPQFNKVQTGYQQGTSDSGFLNDATYTYINYLLKRAPTFFDEIYYSGTGATGNAVAHNLSVVPELIIVKGRSGTIGVNDWQAIVNISSSGYSKVFVNLTDAALGPYTYSNNAGLAAQPTSTTFTVDNVANFNNGSTTYVAYLFATCAGVSKVGSYTGNGTTQTINCGFTGGARFVLIKRTDSTGNWYVYDTARGMTTLTDPYLLLNTSAAPTATLGSVTTVSTGFALNSTILAAINTNAATYIFLAIA